MRTTLTLDEDVAVLLREEAERSRRPFKQVVNQAIRLGLRARSAGAARPAYRTRPHAFGFKPGVDLDRMNQLADELEATEFRPTAGPPR
jgi:hypothetical protein